jgi:hypothetical protein
VVTREQLAAALETVFELLPQAPEGEDGDLEWRAELAGRYGTVRPFIEQLSAVILRALPASSAAWAMARTFPAASAVTAGSGSCAVPASASPTSAVPPSPGASDGRGLVAQGRRGAAGFQVSGMPGLPPLTRVAVPFFSCASRAWRATATLIWACPAIAVTDAPAGSADRAARTAAAGLSPAAGANVFIHGIPVPSDGGAQRGRGDILVSAQASLGAASVIADGVAEKYPNWRSRSATPAEDSR